MLRRAAASLLPRLQQQTQGAAPLSAVLNQFPGCFSLGEDKPSCCAARPYATASEITTAASVGLTPTAYAMKNPTPDITYDSSNHDRFPVGDPSKRAFTYFVLTGGRFVGAAAVRLAVLKFLLSMTATKDVLAMANLEVDMSNIQEGQTVTVKWRGKPVFIRHRTAADIAAANEVDVSKLRDPQTDAERAKDPNWLIVIGVCTHLGCVPLNNAGDYSAWFCPCHGSHYDSSGRIRKGPAPYNLEVPDYVFLDDGKVIIGTNQA
ncbi:cytochrome b-c1 complex subunit Rieske-mitochondrial-like [Micractinium conductrix]|uniref:Cytochrome b-c1 complex subunit Rieske, mitochondrial n=1 Tax=Micractinium conductrix TaxID=554055 RepID=A0A2P6VHD9_9CHLO|nr:cytochrome b-c1 complex subunit Rieske-mitochondrial-like [Micractinium conductrix]|eukprot:PSC73502.1 cytochrome b-c1 complex subunit Rieske-mitochondrial-like [Micractinium conductrix]